MCAGSMEGDFGNAGKKSAIGSQSLESAARLYCESLSKHFAMENHGVVTVTALRYQILCKAW